jgi:putative NADH-flavin reductase
MYLTLHMSFKQGMEAIMRILVLGATGRTGRHLLPLLAAAGHEVTLLGRRTPEGWAGPALIGDPRDKELLARALSGQDAVLSVLASSPREAVCLPVTEGILAADRPELRHILVGGAAVDAPGDRKGLPDRIAGGLMRLFAGRMLAERQEEWRTLAAAGRRFTFFRPPQLTDAPGTGRYELSFDKPAHFRIPRADLAAAMVDALTRDDLIGKAPFVAARK